MCRGRGSFVNFALSFQERGSFRAKPRPPKKDSSKTPLKFCSCLADKFCFLTNHFGAWGAQGPFGGLGLGGVGPD